MADCLFAPINWVSEGTPSWSGGAWALPLANLATADTLAYARSVSADPAATRFVVDLGETRRFDTVALAWHNATAAGKVRLTAAGAPPDFDHDFTTGTLPAGWTFSRASPGTCFGPDGLLRTVAAGVPRFDHDPVTGAPRGLLIEEARTNLIAHSNDLGAWMGGSSASIVANQGEALDGGLTADKATCTGAGGRILASIAVAATTTYTWSFVAQPLVGSFIAVVVVNSELGNPEAHFDLSTGAKVFASGSLIGANSRDLGGGKRRYWISFTTISGGAFSHEIRFFSVGDAVLISDAQREIGAFPSSVIQTTGSAVARSSESLSVDTLLLEWWSSLPITIHAKARRQHNKPSNNAGAGNFSPAFAAWNGATHVVAHIGFSPEYGGSGTPMKAFAGYHLGADLGADEIATDQSIAMAATFQSGSSAMSVVGAPVSSAAAAFAAAPATHLFIGANALSARLDGWVERVSIWTTRLADPRLVAGTADWNAFAGIEWQSGWLDLVPAVHDPVDGYLPFGRASEDGKLPPDERDPRGATFFHSLPVTVDARALTVEIDDSANPSGFVQASLLFVAKGERPSPNVASGISIGIVEDTLRSRSLAGGLHARRRWQRRRITGVLASQRGDQAFATWLETARRAGASNPVLFCADPTAGIHTARGTIIGVLAEPSAIEHVAHGRWGWPFAIEEL